MPAFLLQFFFCQFRSFCMASHRESQSRCVRPDSSLLSVVRALLSNATSFSQPGSQSLHGSGGGAGLPFGFGLLPLFGGISLFVRHHWALVCSRFDFLLVFPKPFLGGNDSY
eukprot:TRINITY_DN49054_c0_g1_i1.p1 TRINITY_DN49054_c0_g1~~TRINITY_DN49054_c0_g1_i1.p1  ORF type:complete len:112 (-),score=2.13 TRINITY_DN49054_c0_g1_i1:90-425(-)